MRWEIGLTRLNDMCVQFLPLLALAATAAGTGAQMVGQSKAKQAMNDATAAERIRQQGIQGRAAAEFDTSLQGSGRDVADKQIASGEQERLSGYQGAQAVPLTSAGGLLVGGQSAALNLQDQAQLSSSNRSRAKLGSYDKWQLDQAIKNIRSAQQQGLYGQEASRSAALLPLELQDASHKGDSWQGVGMGLSALGTLLSLGSMLGAGAGASAGASGATKAGVGVSSMSPAAQAALVSTPLSGLAGSSAALAPFSVAVPSSVGATGGLFPSLAGMGSGVSGLYGLNRKY